jgi:hypothetical protein
LSQISGLVCSVFHYIAVELIRKPELISSRAHR